MRAFNYSAIREQKWDSELLGLISAIYKEMGKQELFLKQRPEELDKLGGDCQGSKHRGFQRDRGDSYDKHPCPSACRGKDNPQKPQ